MSTRKWVNPLLVGSAGGQRVGKPNGSRLRPGFLVNVEKRKKAGKKSLELRAQERTPKGKGRERLWEKR